jgi:hypothetical protein
LLENGHIILFHVLSEIPINNELAITFLHTDKKVKAMLNFDIWNIRMPVFMGLQRLFKAFTLARVISFLLQHSCFLQNTIDRRRAGISNVFVNHHIGTAPITITTVRREERDVPASQQFAVI